MKELIVFVTNFFPSRKTPKNTCWKLSTWNWSILLTSTKTLRLKVTQSAEDEQKALLKPGGHTSTSLHPSQAISDCVQRELFLMKTWLLLRNGINTIRSQKANAKLRFILRKVLATPKIIYTAPLLHIVLLTHWKENLEKFRSRQTVVFFLPIM